jgi:pimeloyl-ACP methyl ester carboxylesterase
LTEQALRFGDDNALSGVLTEASAPSAGVGVAILTAGVTHRVGPHRLHVSLARALSRRGFPTLRFDLSGVGESETASDQDSYEVRTDREVGAALDVLGARTRADRFVLGGLCSGSDNSLRAALREPRVVGVVLLEGYAFRSRGYLLDYYSRRLVRPETWRRLVHGRVSVRQALAGLAGIRLGRAEPADELDDAARFWRMPPPARIVADLRALASRGTEILFVYTRDSPAEYNFRRIIRPELHSEPLRGRVEVKTFRDTDHTFSPLALRSQLIELVTGWAERRFRRADVTNPQVLDRLTADPHVLPPKTSRPEERARH